MKKTIIHILAVIPALLLLGACEKKTDESKQAVATMTGVYYVGVEGSGDVMEVSSAKPVTIPVRAYADEGEVSDLSVNITFKADPDAAEAYNVAHGTSYVMSPGSAYEFTSSEAMMPRYGRSSSSAKLKLSGVGLEDDVTYILPLTIDKVTGTDKWQLKQNPQAYVFFKKAYVAPDAGSGTQEDPYNLYTAKDLKDMKGYLSEEKTIYFRLQADIDMTELTDWEPLNWEAPYKLKIDFDGNGHTLSNFTCTHPNYPSFFGVLYGKCYNVNFVNAEINSNGGATGILGSYGGTSNIPGEAHHIHVQGKVTSPGGNKNGTGGLFGRITEARIYACSADIEIESSEDYVGGIFGYDNGKSDVYDCWTKGTIQGAGRVGGIAGGLIKAGSTIRDCYSLATVKGSHSAAGISGNANLDKKDGNATNEPGNYIENCLAWNESIENISTDDAEHYSCGAIVGYTALKNYLTGCFRKADLNFVECAKNVELGYGLTNQADANPGTPLVVAAVGSYNFPYHGMAAAADATLSSMAKSLGWSQKIWDLSGAVPVIKPLTAEGPNVDAGGQLPDFDENEFYN